MNKELEVGEYVRTKDGIIDKVNNYSLGCNVWHCKNGMCIDECNAIGVYLKDIINHSKNIIDLIEVGDYINGYKVVNSNQDVPEIVLRTDIGFWYINKGNVNEIQSIVTKEQFEQMKYIVKEE